MKNKNIRADLKDRIRLLEEKQTEELTILREQFYETYESLKPVNLIKKAFHDIVGSTELKNDLLSSVVGLIVGYISKKIVIGSSDNIFKKILGSILEFVVANFVRNKAEEFTDECKDI